MNSLMLIMEDDPQNLENLTVTEEMTNPQILEKAKMLCQKRASMAFDGMEKLVQNQEELVKQLREQAVQENQ